MGIQTVKSKKMMMILLVLKSSSSSAFITIIIIIVVVVDPMRDVEVESSQPRTHRREITIAVGWALDTNN